MKIPLSWLRVYTDLHESPQQIAEKLASLGFPVEGIEARPHISGVVVGRIDALTPHPNADRLQVCSIDIGAEQLLTIATAATNVAVGQVVPVATIGAVLPQIKIEPRKMRGIDSQGMLCSAAELGLEAEWFEDGIMQLDRDLPLGRDVIAHFGLLDPVFDVEVTSNRPDVLSVIGVARELAAAYGTRFTMPHLDVHTEGNANDVHVHLKSHDALAFIVQRASNVQAGTAPSMMRIQLALAGQRPINSLVDISNYVMLEFGQPMHFYDAQALADSSITVRDAAEGEELKTLDGDDRTLDPSILVIAGDREILGIAGVRGGASSEVTSTTSEIVIECAAFRAARVRRGAAKLGLRTEASARYEKGIAPALIEFGAARAAYLLAQNGATVSAPKLHGAIPPPAVVDLPRGAADRLLGFAISDGEVTSSLERLGFVVAKHGAGWRVTAPIWRSDIAQTADLIEEVARMIGYDRIEASEAALPPSAISSGAYFRERALALRSAHIGFHEVVTFSLESAQAYARFERAKCAPASMPIEIRNPLSEEQRYLRFSILPGLLTTLQRRMPEIREGSVSLFEISHIFPDIDVANERSEAMWITAIPRNASTDGQPWHDHGFLQFKARMEAILRPFVTGALQAEQAQAAGFHPGKTAFFRDGERIVAIVGALDPRLAAVYDIDADCYIASLPMDLLSEQRPVHYRAPSRFPSVTRDLALALPQAVSSAQVKYIVTDAEPLVKSVHIFDEYRGPQLGSDRKSLAVRVVLQSDETTLTDAQADKAIENILHASLRELGAVLRT